MRPKKDLMSWVICYKVVGDNTPLTRKMEDLWWVAEVSSSVSYWKYFQLPTNHITACHWWITREQGFVFWGVLVWWGMDSEKSSTSCHNILTWNSVQYMICSRPPCSANLKHLRVVFACEWCTFCQILSKFLPDQKGLRVQIYVHMMMNTWPISCIASTEPFSKVEAIF